MASMGFGYAQIHVQQEKCKTKSLKAEGKEKESKEGAVEGEEEHTSEDNKIARGGSWLTGRVHPCAKTAAPVPPNGGK
ncbi:unnamed protein product [Urochloa humidicola]